MGNRTVLYHRVSRKAVVLNPSGAWLWDFLATPRTPGEIAASFEVRTRGAAVESIRSDVLTFLEELRGHELVVESAAAVGEAGAD